MHIATKIGTFYAGFWLLESVGYLSLDHVTLAVAAVFCAGVWEDLNALAAGHRKRERIRSEFDKEQREAARREEEFQRQMRRQNRSLD